MVQGSAKDSGKVYTLLPKFVVPSPGSLLPVTPLIFPVVAQILLSGSSSQKDDKFSIAALVIPYIVNCG